MESSTILSPVTGEVVLEYKLSPVANRVIFSILHQDGALYFIDGYVRSVDMSIKSSSCMELYEGGVFLRGASDKNREETTYIFDMEDGDEAREFCDRLNFALSDYIPEYIQRYYEENVEEYESIEYDEDIEDYEDEEDDEDY